MPNDSSRGPTEQPAPNISADFLTGSTEIGLDRIRTRLLDLTNRNKLLNYRYPIASSLRGVGAHAGPEAPPIPSHSLDIPTALQKNLGESAKVLYKKALVRCYNPDFGYDNFTPSIRLRGACEPVLAGPPERGIRNS